MNLSKSWLRQLFLFMGEESRKGKLLKEKKIVFAKIADAKRRMAEGGWHEDSSYEIADMDIRVWTARLEEIEEELKEMGV